MLLHGRGGKQPSPYYVKKVSQSGKLRTLKVSSSAVAKTIKLYDQSVINVDV